MEILKTENKRIINIAGKQGQLLKRLKGLEEFLKQWVCAGPPSTLRWTCTNFWGSIYSWKSSSY